jgi:fatty-acyl-CoA synthase
MLRHAAAASGRLADLGVGPGDRVAILLPNGWHYAVAYFGIQLSGAIAVPVNTRFITPEIEYVLRDSGARLVLTDEEFATRLAPDSVARPVTAADIVAAADIPGDPAPLPGVARRPDDVAQLLYTSGTTGRPKGAMQTHANLIFNAGTVRERLGAAPGERTLIAAPLFHATGAVSQLVGFISAGACCVLTPRFHADTVLELFVSERITVFAGVAAMLRLLLTREGVGTADLSALRLFIMGGGARDVSGGGGRAAAEVEAGQCLGSDRGHVDRHVRRGRDLPGERVERRPRRVRGRAGRLHRRRAATRPARPGRRAVRPGAGGDSGLLGQAGGDR